MADKQKHAPQVGDKVKNNAWGETIVYTIIDIFDDPFDITYAMLYLKGDTACYPSLLSDLTIVECSPTHKLQIMAKAFDYVSLVRETPFGWVCAIQDNFVDLWDAEGNTPDKAINAVWQSWKGNA
jgi:hypothetical protein